MMKQKINKFIIHFCDPKIYKMRYLTFVLALSVFQLCAFSQVHLIRDPDGRKDYSNVFYKSQYTLFDLWSDEPIYPNHEGVYSIYIATNEDKIPKKFTGSGRQLENLLVYKFKNYENCQSWCLGRIYKPPNKIAQSGSRKSGGQSQTTAAYNSLQEGRAKTTGNSENSNCQDCPCFVSQYEKVGRGYINYCKRIKSNPYSTNFYEYNDWEEKLRKLQDGVMKCLDEKSITRIYALMSEVLAANQSINSVSLSSSSSNSNFSNKSNSSPNQSVGKKSSSRHTFTVLITWDNPNCGSCPFPRPSANNGIVDYFFARAGSYRVVPICPICNKKQYSTISGFTNNIGTSNQGSKSVEVTCNNN